MASSVLGRVRGQVGSEYTIQYNKKHFVSRGRRLESNSYVKMDLVGSGRVVSGDGSI